MTITTTGTTIALDDFHGKRVYGYRQLSAYVRGFSTLNITKAQNRDASLRALDMCIVQIDQYLTTKVDITVVPVDGIRSVLSKLTKTLNQDADFRVEATGARVNETKTYRNAQLSYVHAMEELETCIQIHRLPMSEYALSQGVVLGFPPAPVVANN